jgi:medium-chain acyl-[acyl-carrier-protein] hydrolase
MMPLSTLKHNPWINQVRENSSAKIRLFCFPYSGATASIFYPWAEILPLSIDVCPVQYPGHGNRMGEPLNFRIDALVEQAVQAFTGSFDKPYITFGHSLGALFSFQFVRALRAQDYPLPKIMFVSGHGAPDLPDPHPPIHQLPDKEFIQTLKNLNGMSSEFFENLELMEMLVPVLRADFEICDFYQYRDENSFNFPISAYGGLMDPFVQRNHLEAWHRHTRSEFMVRMFPGDHFYINSSRMVLLQMLARDTLNFL